MTEPNLTEELRAVAREVLDDHVASRQGPATVAADLDPDLWDTLTGMGLTRITGPEDRGGSGAGWAEAAVLLREAAARAVPLPLLEHDLLAGWLRDTAGMPTAGDGLSTSAVLAHPGTVQRVPWLPVAGTVVVLDTTGPEHTAYEIPVAELDVTPGRTVAGEPDGAVALPPASEVPGAVPVDPRTAREWEHRGALGRAVQLAGAMEAVSERCVAHAAERHQFGRPLGRFQAVQQLVTEIACEAALCRAGVERAVAAVAEHGFGDPHARFLVAAAKAATGHAVTRVVRHAHQVHGAIGTTLEHPLQRHTRALLAWRRDHGATQTWEHRLETTALAEVGGDLWDALTR